MMSTATANATVNTHHAVVRGHDRTNPTSRLMPGAAHGSVIT